MTVRELIAALQKLPQGLDVRVWDHEEDDWLPVVEALYEDGTAAVDLLTHAGGPYVQVPVESPSSCPGESK